MLHMPKNIAVTKDRHSVWCLIGKDIYLLIACPRNPPAGDSCNMHIRLLHPDSGCTSANEACCPAGLGPWSSRDLTLRDNGPRWQGTHSVPGHSLAQLIPFQSQCLFIPWDKVNFSYQGISGNSTGSENLRQLDYEALLLTKGKERERSLCPQNVPGSKERKTAADSLGQRKLKSMWVHLTGRLNMISWQTSIWESSPGLWCLTTCHM